MPVSASSEGLRKLIVVVEGEGEQVYADHMVRQEARERGKVLGSF